MKTKNPEISIIVRTKNEEHFLEKVLEKLRRQSFQDFEIIVVDDNSTDQTLKIAKNFNCQIVTIPKGKFSHPLSCNLGAEKASGKYLIYLNGHTIPVSNKFLENGLKNFKDQKVAGVYAIPRTHQGSTLTDKILIDLGSFTLGQLRYQANRFVPGILGTTNAMLRKDLWEQYHFNENFNQGLGGEDSDWARHFIKLGYKIIHDPKFKVRHSHSLKPKDFFWQINNWRKLLTNSKELPEKPRKNF